MGKGRIQVVPGKFKAQSSFYFPGISTSGLYNFSREVKKSSVDIFKTMTAGKTTSTFFLVLVA